MVKTSTCECEVGAQFNPYCHLWMLLIVCIWLVEEKESAKKEHSLFNHHRLEVTQHLFSSYSIDENQSYNPTRMQGSWEMLSLAE